jgi:ribosome-binding factor A
MSKIERISAEIHKQVSYIINYELKDPRVQSGMISVTKVVAAPDLKTCKVYISILSVVDEKEKLAAIKNGSGWIRNELKSKMDIRNMPDLTFILDNSIQYGIKISKIIDDINKNNEK